MKTVFINGSPKKKMSVSSHLLGMLRLIVRGQTVQEQVRNQADHARVLDALRDADNVVFGLPLYVDGVPSHMLVFMKEMERFCRDNGICLNVYVLSNSGFIEGRQNKPLMMVFERFCERAGLRFLGGMGIGGGVMLNVMRIMMYVFMGIFVLNILGAGFAEALDIFGSQLLMVLFYHLGVLFYGLPMARAISKGQDFGVRFTRVMLPSFLFILAADLFFTIISIFQGGIFRGWLSRK